MSNSPQKLPNQCLPILHLNSFESTTNRNDEYDSEVVDDSELVDGEDDDEGGNHANDVKKIPYIAKLLDSCDLHVFHHEYVLQKFNERGPISLFYLFIHETFLTNYTRKVTEDNLQSKNYAKKFVSKNEIKAVVGLEIGLSLCGGKTIRQSWNSNVLFGGHQDFEKIMKLGTFKILRSSFAFVNKQSLFQMGYSRDGVKKCLKLIDPLFSVRPALNHFWQNIVSVAVPIGSTALDENGCATRARSRAKTYLPNKPDKYAIRFYSIVGNKYNYLFSMFDNGAGNDSSVSIARRYCDLHKIMDKCYVNTFFDTDIPSNLPMRESDELKKGAQTQPLSLVRKRKRKKSVQGPKETFVDPTSASALWAMQISHMSKLLPMEKANVKSKTRICWTDNYYTRRQLAAQCHDIDKEIQCAGTVRSNFIDDVNKYFFNIAKAEFMKHANIGDWCLLPAFHPHPDHDKHKANHKKDMENIVKEKRRRATLTKRSNNSSNETLETTSTVRTNAKQQFVLEYYKKLKDEELVVTEFIPDLSYQVPNAGYLLFYDNNMVTMYHSGLAKTPKRYPVYCYGEKKISSKEDIDYSIICVHGLGPFERWHDDKATNKSIFQVPSIIIAYNTFMNAVDVMDQMRSTSVTKRKEQHIHMSVWTMVLDLAIHNAFAIYKWISDNHPQYTKNKIKQLREFKRVIAEALVRPYMEQKQQETESLQQKETIPHQRCSLDMLASGKKRAQISCRLCKLFGKRVGTKKPQTPQTTTYCNVCCYGFHDMCFEVRHNLDKYPDVKERITRMGLMDELNKVGSLSEHASGKILYPFDE